MKPFNGRMMDIRKSIILVTTVAAIFIWLFIAADTSDAQTKNTRYSSMAEWNLKAENLVPWGRNPYYQPLEPGHKYVMENPILAGGLIYYKYGKNLEKKLQKCNVVFL